MPAPVPSTPVAARRPLPAARVVARAPQEGHHGAASPEAHKTALIHLTERVKLARADLREAKARGGEDRVRIARERVVAAYLDLHALRDAVGVTKAAVWKLEGYDVEAAWKTYGMPLPPVEDLRRDERIAPIAGAGRLAFRGGSAVMAVLATMIVAVLALNGTVPWAPLVRAAEWLRFHKLIGFAAAAVGGYLAGGPAVDGLNRLLGFKRGPDPIAE